MRNALSLRETPTSTTASRLMRPIVLMVVPDLTSVSGIKLNARVSLRRAGVRLPSRPVASDGSPIYEYRAIRDAAVRGVPPKTRSATLLTSSNCFAEKERRAVGRTRINRSALVFFHGQSTVFSCSVRDVTNSGVGIRLETLNVLPVEFYLSFDRFRTARECRLIWRDVDFLGIAFEDGACDRSRKI